MRTTRQFLTLHNMESITGGALAIQQTLPAAERNALRDWLSATVESSRGRTVKGPCG